MSLVFFTVLWYNRVMSMGNVKHSIQIEEIKDDIFSDDIKTTALIEEIEAAELVAKRAKIERQIENSQPNRMQVLGKKLVNKATDTKENIIKAFADLKMKQPKDPRVKKVSIRQRLEDILRKINSLAPNGVSRKTLIEACLVGALAVAATEIWAWNLSHPLFKSKSGENIEVPIAGDIIDSNEEEEDSPILNTDETAVEQKEEKSDSNNTSTGETNIRNYTTSRQNSTTSTRQKATNNSKAKTTTTTTTTPKNTATTIDGEWNDNYNSGWPTYEESEAPTPENNNSDESSGENSENSQETTTDTE